LYLKKECERLIYEVRLRDVPIRRSTALLDDAGLIDNFITYVIAEDDATAMELATEIANNLLAKKVRSVVAQPRMSLEIIYKVLDMLSSKPRKSDEIKSILKFSKQAFKGFKGYKE